MKRELPNKKKKNMMEITCKKNKSMADRKGTRKKLGRLHRNKLVFSIKLVFCVAAILCTSPAEETCKNYCGIIL